MTEKYQVAQLEHEHETQLRKDFGPVFFLTDFPNYTSPFWNMQQSDDGKRAHKVDVILHGMETIGSAERSCNANDMRNSSIRLVMDNMRIFFLVILPKKEWKLN